MTKVKSHARWNRLSRAQLGLLEQWLFEDRMSYPEVLERARKELGFQGSVSSLRRYYARRAQERMIEGFGEAATMAEKLEGVTVSAERLRSAGMKVAAQLFLKQITEQPDQPKEWAFLAKLLLQQRDSEVRERWKMEQSAIRRESLAFARERFQYNAVENALKALPELQELARARMDPQTALYEERKRTNEIIRNMFGPQPPTPFKPECEAEEEPYRLALEKLEEKRKMEAEREQRARQELLRQQQEAAEKKLDEEEGVVACDVMEEPGASAGAIPEQKEGKKKLTASEVLEKSTVWMTDEEWCKLHPNY